MRWRSRHSQPSSHQSVRSSYPSCTKRANSRTVTGTSPISKAAVRARSRGCSGGSPSGGSLPRQNSPVGTRRKVPGRGSRSPNARAAAIRSSSGAAGSSNALGTELTPPKYQRAPRSRGAPRPQATLREGERVVGREIHLGEVVVGRGVVDRGHRTEGGIAGRRRGNRVLGRSSYPQSSWPGADTE